MFPESLKSREPALEQVAMPTDNARRPLVASAGVSIFVGLCWAAMFLATLWLVWVHGLRVPWMDHYKFEVPILSGERPLTLAWVWEQYTDARIPLAKLMNLALVTVASGDFRAAAFVNVLALGAVAFALLWVTARLRGRLVPTDAVFPLLLLCWAQWENLIWGLQLFAVMSHVILFALLLVLAMHRQYPSPHAALLVGGAIALFPILGPSTLAYVPALLVWLPCLMIHLWREPRCLRGTAVGVLSCGAVAITLTYVYFVRQEKYWVEPTRESLGASIPDGDSVQPIDDGDEPEQDTETNGPLPTTEQAESGVDSSASTLASSLDGLRTLANESLPLVSMALATDEVSLMGAVNGNRPLYVYVGRSLQVLYVATAVLLAWVCVRRRAERLRAAGLLSFLLGSGCFFAAMTVARPLGLEVLAQQRYALFAMPPLVCSILAWVLYGPRQVAGFIQVVLFCAVGGLFPLNTDYGWRYTALMRESLDIFAQDLVSGKPAYVLANQHIARLMFQAEDPSADEKLQKWLAERFRGLREHGIKPFDGMAPDSEGIRVPLGKNALAAAENMEWDGDLAKGQDGAAALTYLLARPRHVLAIGVRYTLATDSGQATGGKVVSQDGGDGKETTIPLRLIPTAAQPGYKGRWAWIWIDDRIDRFRIHPDESPFALRVEQLVLMVPGRATQPAQQ